MDSQPTIKNPLNNTVPLGATEDINPTTENTSPSIDFDFQFPETLVEEPTIEAEQPFSGEEIPEATMSLEELLKKPCMRYWRRLIDKELKDHHLKREVIALLGIFKVYTPKELSGKFNVCLAYVYKLIKSAVALSECSPESIGEMMLAHPEILAKLMEASPETAAFFITQFVDLHKLAEVVERRTSVEVEEVELEKDLVLRFILTLAMECRASAENIQVSLQYVLGYTTSTTAIENIIKKYEEVGREMAKELDMLVLPKIAAVALDEIFQHDTPIFTVVDLDSTYAILIKPREDRKGETWKAELEQLKKLGLNPDSFTTDACGSILLAVPQSFEDAVVVIDIFHILKGLNDAICQAIRKKEVPITDAEDIWKKVLDGVNIQARTWEKLEKLEALIPEIKRQVEEIRTLRKWIIELVDYSGYTKDETMDLISWCLDELDRIAGRRWKEDEKEHVSKFSKAIDTFKANLPKSLNKYLVLFEGHLNTQADETGICMDQLEAVYRLRRHVPSSRAYDSAKRKACLECRCDWQQISNAEDAVNRAIQKTPRASSLVENLNSRIRPALIKKKVLTDDYLNLLRLYLNTRPYRRSRKEERKGKSPYEIVTGDGTVNFFTLLGIAVAKPAVLAA